jgi:hypothetical protein
MLLLLLFVWQLVVLLHRSCGRPEIIPYAYLCPDSCTDRTNGLRPDISKVWFHKLPLLSNLSIRLPILIIPRLINIDILIIYQQIDDHCYRSWNRAAN